MYIYAQEREIVKSIDGEIYFVSDNCFIFIVKYLFC